MNAEDQVKRIEEAVAGALRPGLVVRPEVLASELYAKGVRVLGPEETILNRSDAKLLDLMRQAAEGWERAKQEAKERSREKLDTPAFREAKILAAMIGAGKPLPRISAIQAAAGWHRDYRPPSTEWEPWRAAWRQLLIMKKIRRANPQELGAETLWEVSRGA